jgi:ATP-dependent DNA ligase
LLYEPKWDGFRCIVFRDGDDVELGSRNERPLTRYFPEVVDALKANLPDRCVIDGEVVVATEHGLDFEVLQQRIHPANSRVQKLARETPASFVGFDCLALGDDDLRAEPFRSRRDALERALGGAKPPVHLTPITEDPAVAAVWFEKFEGAGLDGVVAKPSSLPYREDERVMVKVKHERTAEFVVAGFRWHKSGGVIGSLLLGLYDEAGTLHHVGVIGAFPMRQREELVAFLAPWRENTAGHPWEEWALAEAHEGQRLPGAVSRWNAKKDLSFEMLRPELVVEAAYEHMQGTRLRHAAQFRRFRPERDPASCTYDQLDIAVPAVLSEVFGA